MSDVTRPGEETPVPSPCIDVCWIHRATGLCEGCLRTRAEIAGWVRMDDAEKRAVWAAIEVRRAPLEAAAAIGPTRRDVPVPVPQS